MCQHPTLKFIWTEIPKIPKGVPVARTLGRACKRRRDTQADVHKPPPIRWTVPTGVKHAHTLIISNDPPQK